MIKLVRAKRFEKNSFFWFADAKMIPEFVKLAPEMKIKVNASDIEGVKNGRLYVNLRMWKLVRKT